jgi:hypothetical protein
MEAFGKLFTDNLKVYIYPARHRDTKEIINTGNMPVDDEIRFLYKHLLENGCILDIPEYREEILLYNSRTVLKRIKMKDPCWEDMVPRYVSAFIKTKNLFGYNNS